MLSGETSAEIIRHMKSIFARHGIPQEVMSDNGPLFVSMLFKEFAKEYVFSHLTSSPRYPQANGEAERAVKTIKRLINNAEDPYLALLAYRSTLQNGYSPSELVMNRKLRTTVPMAPTQMQPSLPDYNQLQKKEEENRQSQKTNYDHHHKARPLKLLVPGQRVWITDMRIEGTVKQQTAPRSYLIATPQGMIRRNRRHFKYYPIQGGQKTGLEEAIYPDSEDENMSNTENMPDPEPESDGIQSTKSSRWSRRPDYLNPTW